MKVTLKKIILLKILEISNFKNGNGLFIYFTFITNQVNNLENRIEQQ